MKAARLLIVLLLATAPFYAQTKITSPREEFGFNIGDDYYLANYTQLVNYWKKLDRESDRMSMVDIGKTAEGRTIYMAIITSPENHKNLARYKDISRRLALAEGLTDEQARALAAEGKAVVWIDGGLHANEVLGAQQLIEAVYQQVSRTDPETMRFLNDVILLAVCVNPDGLDLVANWYMRQSDPLQRSLDGVPRLYQKYAGHDNNRDFYMSAQPESEAINRVLFREWFPQIVYNHHQTGPQGTVMFAPPFRDPFNFNFDPLVVVGIDLVAATMHSRFISEGKPGVTMRSGANYSTWWNGGLRTSPYFHNQIGLLTETIGSPTPMDIPLVTAKQLPNGDLPYPIAPQKWHFRQSIEYSITANRAVMDAASRNRDLFLFNAYRMGRNSIERGMKDSWTAQPDRIREITDLMAKERPTGSPPSPALSAKYYSMLQDPAFRDPRGYIIPADQSDFLTAIKFVNTLIKNGIAIQRASGAFAVNGKTYPAGSLIVKTAQAFRPHVLDMFEPQNHPDDFAYPGAPPTPPYDIAGWTLAFQMGVKFDRILDAFNGPFQRVLNEVKPPAGRVTQITNPAGYLLSHETNDSFIAVNRLLASNEDVFWTKSAFRANGKTYPAGIHFIPAKPATLPKLQKLATEVGLTFEATAAKPAVQAFMLHPLRIGLWDQENGTESSGWARFVLENFEFPYSVVYTKTLEAGNLAQAYDALIFVDDASLNQANIAPQLRKFVEDGGSILAIGGSANMFSMLNLPVANALVERSPEGRERPLPATKFYVPGSILQVKVDNKNPLAFGLGESVDVFYDNDPSFRLQPGADARGINAVAWFDNANPLRSGWAWGRKYLENTVAIIDATVGKGKVFLFGPEIMFRSQPHGTFKFLFNGIYYGSSETVNLVN